MEEIKKKIREKESEDRDIAKQLEDIASYLLITLHMNAQPYIHMHFHYP